ncbi:MAG: hypothetical protein HW402_1444 [Dehalococcoidales bacterium]|nr:hypothetical protein [Dehalococcoidales bacterium]
MTVWEYQIDRGLYTFGGRLTPEELQERLNKRGEDGWELVSILSMTEPREDWWIFKRPMPTRKPKA